MAEWIHKFKGRNGSLAIDQNFLWRHENIYIMDNHRASLWCWLQQHNPENKINLFHIDAHYDAAQTISDEEYRNLPDLTKISFEEYLSLSQPGFGLGNKEIPMIRWDNYLYLFELLCRKQIDKYFVATHCIGSEPSKDIRWEEIYMWDLPEMFIDFVMRYKNNKWIINIDLDYFFSRQPKDFHVIQSDHYISEIFTSLSSIMNDGNIECLTICLSPECCGGWRNAEELCYQLCGEIGVEFKLPDNV